MPYDRKRDAPPRNQKRQAISENDQKCAWRRSELALQIMGGTQPGDAMGGSTDGAIIRRSDGDSKKIVCPNTLNSLDTLQNQCRILASHAGPFCLARTSPSQ